MKRLLLLVALLVMGSALWAQNAGTAQWWYSMTVPEQANVMAGFLQGIQFAGDMLGEWNQPPDATIAVFGLPSRLSKIGIVAIVAQVTVYFSTPNHSRNSLADAVMWSMADLTDSRPPIAPVPPGTR